MGGYGEGWEKPCYPYFVVCIVLTHRLAPATRDWSLSTALLHQVSESDLSARNASGTRRLAWTAERTDDGKIEAPREVVDSQRSLSLIFNSRFVRLSAKGRATLESLTRC